MAIKVGGTDVIDNSRGLKNIATVDATTAASITAAGVGGGGSLDFTADEAISAGDPVAVKTNGNIEGISASLSRNNTSTQTANQINTYGVGVEIVFNKARKHYTRYYRNSGNDFRGRTIIFGEDDPNIKSSPQYGNPGFAEGYVIGDDRSIYNSRAANYFIGLYDETYDRDLVLFLDGSNSNVEVACINTENDTATGNYQWIPSLSDTQTIHSSSGWEGHDFCYDAGSGYYFVVTSRFGNNVSITPVQFINGANSLTVGTTTQIISNERYAPIKIATDGNGQFLLHARDDNNANQIVVPFTIDTSGGFYSISYTVGSASTVLSSPTNSWDTAQVAYDNASGKFVLYYYDLYTSEVRAASVSNNSVTLHTSTTVTNGNYKASFFDYGDYGLGMVFYQDSQSRMEVQNVVVNSSTGAITFTNNMALANNAVSYSAYNFSAASSASLGNIKFTVLSHETQSSWTSYFYYNTVNVDSNNTKTVGFAESAISASSSGSVTVVGGVNDQQSGLTASSKYYISPGGGLTTTAGTNEYAGIAISSTELLVKG